ncbi:MAG: substrate-binding domain-containing protein [Alphaproteobacteria bacterium]
MFKNFKKKIITQIIILASLVITISQAQGNAVRNLTIYAEPNLFVAFTKIARIYSQNFAVNVSLNFNPSLDFVDEIDSGEPADIFISAHPIFAETMKQKGLIDVYNIGYIANDELILVTSKDNKELPVKFIDNNLSLEEAIRLIDQSKNNIIIDHEGNSSGFFAKNFLQNFTLENLSIFSKLPEDKNSIIRDLTNDPNSYALIFASHLRNAKNLQILARKKDKNIYYRALVIAGDNMEVAREFLKFLKKSQSQKILQENGFFIN